MKASPVLAAALAAAFGSASLLAQSAPSPSSPPPPPAAADEVLNLNEMIVTSGGLYPSTRFETPVATTTVDRMQLDDEQPRSIVDLMKLIPTFYIESSAGEGNGNLFTRGLQSGGGFHQVSLEEDGLPVFSENDLSFAGAESWLRYDTFLSTVQAVRGGAAEVLATDAPGGVIDFIDREGTPTFQGNLQLETGDYGLYRTDLWVSGPLSPSTTYAIGGFYGLDNGIRSPGFVADKGGQLHLNVKHVFADGKGYIKFLAKVDNHNILNGFPIPVLNDGNGYVSSIPGGPNIRTATNMSADTAQMDLGNTPAGYLDYNGQNGFHNNLWYAGIEFSYDVAEGLKLTDLARYSYVDRPGIVMNDNAIPATFQSIVNSIATKATSKGQFAAALESNGNYDYELTQTSTGNVIAASPAAATTLNGNGLGILYNYNMDHENITDFQDDLRLTKTFDDGHSTASAGFYFSDLSETEFRETNVFLSSLGPQSQRVDVTFLNAATGAPIGPGTWNSLTQVSNGGYTNVNYEEKQLAYYLSLEHKVGPLVFDIGGRLDQEQGEGNLENTTSWYESNGVWSQGTTAQAPAGTNPALVNASWGTGQFIHGTVPTLDAYNGSAAVNYTLTQGLALFANFAYGTRLPVMENHFTTPADISETVFNPAVEPTEFMRQYEVGAKYSGPDFAAFLTAFYIQDEDFTNNQIVINPTTGATTTQSTVSSTSTPGLELEADWTPLPGLNINPVYTLQNMRYTSDTLQTEAIEGVLTQISLLGLHPVRQPGLQGEINTDYTFPGTSWGRFNLSGTWRYVGIRELDAANTVPIHAFNEFNFAASLTTPSRYTFRAQISNAFDSDGLTEGDTRVTTSPTGQYLIVRPVLPRSIEVMVSKSF